MQKALAKPRFSRNELILLGVLFGAYLAVAIGVQMGSALLPALSRQFDVPVSRVTLLISGLAFAGLSAPLMGPISDRLGHGTFVLIGLVLSIAGNLLSAAAPSFGVLMLSQILVGVGYAAFSFSLSAVMGDAFAYDVRGRAMGLVRFAWSTAALMGVPAAATIADWSNPRTSFAAVGGLGLLVMPWAWLVLGKRRQAGHAANPEKASGTWSVMTKIIRTRAAVAGLLIIMGWAAIPSGLLIYLAAWLEQAFQLENGVGLAFSFVGVGAIFGTALMTLLTDRLGKKRSAGLALLVIAAAAPLLSRAPSLAAVLACLVTVFIAMEFGFASLTTLMTELMPEARGTLMSIAGLVSSLGTGLAPIIGRPLWERYGYDAVTLTLGLVCLGAVVLLVLFVEEQ